jgi:hypothetical protein
MQPSCMLPYMSDIFYLVLCKRVVFPCFTHLHAMYLMKATCMSAY